MKHKLKRSLLLLPLFLLLLQSNVATKSVTGVKAETNNWTEVDTITSGKHYIISTLATNGNKYYLKAGGYGGTPLGIEFADVEALILGDAWTFVGDNNSFVITSADGHRLYIENGNSIGVRALVNINKGLVATDVWTYNENQLKFDKQFLSLNVDGTFISWRSPSGTGAAGFAFNLTFYEYNATVVEELSRFTSVMNAWVGNKAKGKCEEFVPTLLKYYDGLSNGAKTEFAENIDYSSYHNDVTYFTAWYEHYQSTQPEAGVRKAFNKGSLIYIALFSVIPLSSYLFIVKRKKQA